jgi:hypothetical protein
MGGIWTDVNRISIKNMSIKNYSRHFLIFVSPCIFMIQQCLLQQMHNLIFIYDKRKQLLDDLGDRRG